MGLEISLLFCRLFRKKPMRMLMLGLDDAGKTTILYKLKLGEVLTTIPSMGFNVETVEYKNMSFTIWDMTGSQARMKYFWPHYYPNTDGIIYVVDSNDRERVDKSADEIHMVLDANTLRDSVLLVFANKQDLPNAMSTDELIAKLKLNTLKDRRWYIQAVCAIQETGLYEGFEWLANELSKK